MKTAENYVQIKERLEAATKFLDAQTTTLEKFNSARKLIKGINPGMDKTLDKISDTIDEIQKLQKGDIIELSLEKLPESTEEEKKRKKKILLLIKYWKQLYEEIARAKKEFGKEKNKPHQDNLSHSAKLLSSAKGPFGILTIAAIIIVGSLMLINSKQKAKQIPSNPVSLTGSPAPSVIKIQGIIVNGKKIPLSELVVLRGQECDKENHYHAKDHTAAKSLDGIVIADPGGCGFGKVKDVQVVDIQ